MRMKNWISIKIWIRIKNHSCKKKNKWKTSSSTNFPIRHRRKFLSIRINACIGILPVGKPTGGINKWHTSTCSKAIRRPPQHSAIQHGFMQMHHVYIYIRALLLQLGFDLRIYDLIGARKSLAPEREKDDSHDAEKYWP